MTISDWLMISAVVIGPIAAVQIQKWLESKKEKKAGKLHVFKVLMATRAMPVSPGHVEALNMIDIEFYDIKKVKESWKLLLDSFANYPQGTSSHDYLTRLNSCSERSKDLLTDLLYEMAKSLGYDFDKVHLKREVYFPQGHVDIENDQLLLRKSLVGVMSGKGAIPVKIVHSPKEEKQQEQKHM